MLTDNSSSAVVVSKFCKSYGRGKTYKNACLNIDFTAERGCITGLLGPNGAGKTTLLKAICKIHYPDSGSVCVPGKVAFVPENPESEDGNLTVCESLYFQSLISGKSEHDSLLLVKGLLKDFALKDAASAKIFLLSKGFRQRVNLARALAGEPDVIVMDEFSSGLDPVQIVSMKKLIKKTSENKIVILSTHNIDHALQLCKKLYIMHKGMIVCHGSEKEILQTCGENSFEEAFVKLTEG